MKLMVETDNGKMVELKPCPFCGGKILHIYHGQEGVRCESCGAKITDCEDAIERWNRRTIELETKPLRYDVVEIVACSDGPITGPSWDDSETWSDTCIVKFSSEDREEAVRFMDGLPIGTRAFIECIREHQEIVWKRDVLVRDWKRPRSPLHPHREPTFEPLPDGRHVLPDLNIEVTVKNGVYSFKPLEEDRRRYDDDPSVR